MARRIERLTALALQRAHSRPVACLLADGNGLYLRRQSSAGKHSASTWMLRYRFGGIERWMAPGNSPDVGLAVARAEAASARKLLDTANRLNFR